MMPNDAQEEGSHVQGRKIERARGEEFGWRRWSPYVSDRAWGTVREDYSANGDAWNFLTHDMARSKAYRWGEDGVAGICDRYELLVFTLASWNGRDPILKERLFWLNPLEGNHGEDVGSYAYVSPILPNLLSYAASLRNCSCPVAALPERPL